MSHCRCESYESQFDDKHAAKDVTFLHGDFVALAPEIPPADVVTLDRVI